MNKEFIISEEIFQKCLKFANDSVESSLDKYAQRNQFNSFKIIKDIRNGKIAEQMVYNILKPYLPDLTEPDYNIYDKYNKSWDPDLKANNIKLAVKSQDYESALRYSHSWIFQKTDKEIFQNKDDNKYVVFVSENVALYEGSIVAIVKVNWLHENNLFKSMKREVLQSNKLAVYLNDLKEFDNLWQLNL